MTMTTHALSRRNLYEELVALPESLIGEILDGQLYAHPRPGGRHVLAASNISAEFHGPYQRGRGGPGGWWILLEPEVHFVKDEEVAVPDVAGWRKERMPAIPESHRFTVVPDWICEVLSPSTESIDREIKMPLYARFGVQYLWLAHPKTRSLEAFKLVDGSWISQGCFSG
ncbi:MAG: Uma2 family endonuclease, partial [Gammaproteobacteria bacterium]